MTQPVPGTARQVQSGARSLTGTEMDQVFISFFSLSIWAAFRWNVSRTQGC
jgi:hypothetical protein